jgi:acyl-CoA synthetase (AMP-forming)/AMP-acid ligase II
MSPMRKIACKRLGPAELESVVFGHDAAAEASVIGAPYEAKGEAVVSFVMLKPGTSASEPLRVITYFGKEPGDISSLENPAAVKAGAVAT